MKGIFIISLDYELFWGMHDAASIRTYGKNILGTYTVIPKLLALFERYQVHSTWAAVGMMHAENARQLKEYLPDQKPAYQNKICSSYRCLNVLASGRGTMDRYFFAPDMLEKICLAKGTELGSHTFSHYYCQEPGQTIEQFQKDIQSDRNITARAGSRIVSLVFPKNQSDSRYVKAAEKYGFAAFRGAEENWVQKIKCRFLKRMFRFADAYVPLTHTNEYRTEYCGRILNLHGSRMFRPYNPKLFFLEGLKLRRIKKQMLSAARTGRIFHLWWHPHNIGIYQHQNLLQIEEICRYYQVLCSRYGMKSMNMKEAAGYFRHCAKQEAARSI